MRYPKTFEVIVIGAGHAGIEAALACARLKLDTLLLTINVDTVGRMSCNPAIGGPGKSQLVREIDALGGEMGKAADNTYVQMKMLNLSKGPAVHSLRAQSDRLEYISYMKQVLENTEHLFLKQGMATELIMKGKNFAGVKTQEGFDYYGKAVVITTGTFLRGRIFIGLKSTPAGRAGEFAAEDLTKSLNKIGIKTGRLKTGTPARIDAKTVDFSKMQKEPGMEKLKYFSFETTNIIRRQIPCYLTHTNAQTHKVILSNLDRSPLYQKMIDGIGPRYCPSIEDKVVRFKDKKSHQLFIEPEGYNTNELYVQGMSTSLPYDIQLKFLRTIKGLEKVEITRPGYAIAYDFVFPEQLERTLKIKKVQGIYTAGQINGTSGYEEAAAQGIVAGINAALWLQKKEPLLLAREDSYIGTLIDDLITKEIREPYRMMTSRSEYRLYLRQDNADSRLLEKGYQVGLVSKQKYQNFKNREKKISHEIENLKKNKLSPNKKTLAILNTIGENLNQPTSYFNLLKRARVDLNFLNKLEYSYVNYSLTDLEKEKIEIEVKYFDYINKVREQIALAEKNENKKLNQAIPYLEIKGLSNEAKEKLNKIRPTTIGQASRIAGVSPADVSVLLIWLEVWRGAKKSGKTSRTRKSVSRGTTKK